MENSVKAEIDFLTSVLTHSPDEGIERVTPEKSMDYLYDDIAFLPAMVEEHRRFTNVLRAFCGDQNVYDVSTMLLECLTMSDTLHENLIREISDLERVSVENRRRLRDLTDEELVYTLINGTFKKDDKRVFGPIPNMIFTRDLAVVIKDHLIICNFNKKARQREALLMRFLAFNHPVFHSFSRNNRIIDLNKGGADATIEGGDIMVIASRFLFVGLSERTTMDGINLLKKEIFNRGIIENIVVVKIPDNRSFMHIDTLFTQINEHQFVGLVSIIDNKEKISIEVYSQENNTVKTYEKFSDFYNQCVGDLSLIPCAGGIYPFDEREQWTDGCNLVAIKPGVAIAYHRNLRTNAVFESHGYRLLDADEFMLQYNGGLIDTAKVQNTIITVKSSELIRARGGPHCMTMPICRTQ